MPGSCGAASIVAPTIYVHSLNWLVEGVVIIELSLKIMITIFFLGLSMNWKVCSGAIGTYFFLWCQGYT